MMIGERERAADIGQMNLPALRIVQIAEQRAVRLGVEDDGAYHRHPDQRIAPQAAQIPGISGIVFVARSLRAKKAHLAGEDKRPGRAHQAAPPRSMQFL